MDEFPEMIRIAGVDYDIRFVDKLVSDGLECFGMIEFPKSVIKMSENQSDQMMLVTLLHEALHGIVYHYNVPIPPENEEEVVEAITSGLHQLLVDNFFPSPYQEEAQDD